MAHVYCSIVQQITFFLKVKNDDARNTVVLQRNHKVNHNFSKCSFGRCSIARQRLAKKRKVRESEQHFTPQRRSFLKKIKKFKETFENGPNERHNPTHITAVVLYRNCKGALLSSLEPTASGGTSASTTCRSIPHDKQHAPLIL